MCLIYAMALGCGDYSCSCVVCIVSLEKFKVVFSEGAKKKILGEANYIEQNFKL